MKNKIVKAKNAINMTVIILCISLVFTLIALIFHVVGINKNEVEVTSSDNVYESQTFFDEDEDYLIYYKNTVLNKVNDNSKVKIDEFLKMDRLDEFTNKVNELIYLKYPEFIATELVKTSTVKEYNIHDNYLEIIFSNYTYENELGSINLKVFYNEIKDYVVYDVNYVADYVNETGQEYDPAKKTIAFTFDDGPHGVYTEKIMDSLTKNKAGATFFMLGLQIELLPNVAKKVVDNGFEVGLHSYSHKNFTRQSISDTVYELERTNQLLYNAAGITTNLVRPPYGSINSTIQNEVDYSYILWNVDTDDWRYKDVDRLVNHVLDNVSDGDIVLFHDIFAPSAEAVKKVLPELYLKGYQVVDVGTLAKTKGQTIDLNKTYGSFK